MGEYAPEALHQLFSLIHSKLGTAELGGIEGNAAHVYGYHRARDVLPSSDYSVKLAKDKLGDGWACSALDVTLGETAIMHTVTRRLLAARKDPRMAPVREFFGCLVNGGPIVGWDWSYGGPTSSDDLTHRWHVHISILRYDANNFTALAPIADVFAGVPIVKPVKPPTGAGKGSSKPAPPSRAVLHRAWPKYMGTKDYFGLITGPSISHGGVNAAERADVLAIQKRLQVLGFASKDAGWADGIFGGPTRLAVIAWQRKHGYAQSGEVTVSRWINLFTY